VIGFITNNSFLDGVIHRGIRECLFEAFDKIYILNLHGNSRIKETCPDGSKDENVFDIKTGVCISFFIKGGNLIKEGKISKTKRSLSSSTFMDYDLINMTI
jgi:predicted helicase